MSLDRLALVALLGSLMLGGTTTAANADEAAMLDSAAAAVGNVTPGATPCFALKRIAVDGLVPALDWLPAELQSYARGCLDAQGADRIVHAAQDLLVGRGFVTTRLRVPEQDVSHGDFRIVVTPGRIREVKIVSPAPATTWKNAFPTGPGRLLNLRDLEQGLEQMKRVPSQDVQMQIAPAAKPGESDVDIAVKRTKRWHVSFDLNDAGSQQTGPLQGSATIALDNPLHLNDLLNVTLNTNVSGGIGSGTQGNSLYYSIPKGYSTLELSTGISNYSQTIAGRTAPFTLSGTTHNTSIGLERMLARSQIGKTSVTLRLTQSSSRSFVNDTEIDVQRRDATFGEMVLKHSMSNARSSLDVSLGLRAGLPLFGSLPDPQNVVDAPTSYYTMETVEASASTLLSRKFGIRLTSRLSSQFTGDRIPTSNTFSIGNRYTVRGFDGTSALAAESGYFVRNEVEVPLPASGRSMYVGLDTGHVYGPSTLGLAGTALTGTVVGFRTRSTHATMDVFTGFALGAPAGFRTAEPAAGLDLTYRL